MSSSVSSLLHRARISDGSVLGCISFFHVPASATPVSGRLLHACSNHRASEMSALTCSRPANIGANSLAAPQIDLMGFDSRPPLPPLIGQGVPIIACKHGPALIHYVKG